MNNDRLEWGRMGNADSNRFSAAGSALGYLAQVEYALLIALRRMDDEDNLRISLETVDDITFDRDGMPRELWQTKHHVNHQGGIGNSSPDLWKTIHNWIETSNEESACVLFTTATASDGTAAHLLRSGRSDDDVFAARSQLDAVATKAGNAASAEYYRTYMSLTEQHRTELLSRIVVIDSAVTGEMITDQLLASVRKAVIKTRRDSLVERLRGWWHGRTMSHLNKIAQGEEDWIELLEIEDQLHFIAQSLRDDNLPLDYENEPEPTSEQVKNDERIFVEQLKLILLHHDRIRQAVYDHNRAYLQRSRWQREQLLAIDDLDTYDRSLIEEWKRIFSPLEEPQEGTTDDDKRESARGSYGRLQERTLPAIRPGVRAGYVSFGSMHILADRLEIGWHPDWVDLLKHRLNTADNWAAA